MIDASDVAHLLEAQLQGHGHWNHRDDQTPVDGLKQAARASGELAPAFARTLVALLEHEDPVLRAGAMAPISAVADHVAADQLLAIVESRAALRNQEPGRQLHPRWDARSCPTLPDAVIDPVPSGAFGASPTGVKP